MHQILTDHSKSGHKDSPVQNHWDIKQKKKDIKVGEELKEGDGIVEGRQRNEPQSDSNQHAHYA